MARRAIPDRDGAAAVAAGKKRIINMTTTPRASPIHHPVDATGCHPASDALVAERAGDCRASLLLCGHSHLPRAVRLPDGRTVVNPGSVGLQAFDWDHARYAMIERTPGGWAVEHVQVAYDWESMARLADANGRPLWATALRTGALD